MRVTVQNGSKHGFARRELEIMVQLFPPSWSRWVDSIVLYQSNKPDVEVIYYPKQKVLGVFWPDESAPNVTKSDALEKLLVALSIVADRGELPPKVAQSTYKNAQESIFPLMQKCLSSVAANAA